MCIWREWNGVLCCELLLEDQTINSNKYSSQLGHLKAALDEKHQELIDRKLTLFHQDNSRPHDSLMCDDQEKTVRACLGISDSSTIFTKHGAFEFPFVLVFTRFSYWKKKINSLEDCKRYLEQFFAQEDKKFLENGIMTLPGKWQKIVEQNGEYVVQ